MINTGMRSIALIFASAYLITIAFLPLCLFAVNIRLFSLIVIILR